jgi:hypothetical protein
MSLALGLLAVVAVLVAVLAMTTLDGVPRADADHPDPGLQCGSSIPIECVSLDPQTGSNTVGDVHTVIATVTTDADGQPVEGVDLYIFVIKGPNAGERIQALTNAAGEVALTYTGDGGLGTDQMGTEACLSDGCSFDVDGFIDDCIKDEASQDNCVNTFFVDPTCNGSVEDSFLCHNATKDWVAATATPTPTPSPSPTPAPSAAAPAAGLPSTGGTPSDGGSGSLPWLATLAGVFAATLIAGGWYARRHLLR